MEAAAGIVALLVIVCIALCAHYLQQIRDELRKMNGEKPKASSSGSGYLRR